ncbi:MAG TPA: hypothetical protein VF053_18410 [Streptosporangiales bacterium]
MTLSLFTTVLRSVRSGTGRLGRLLLGVAVVAPVMLLGAGCVSLVACASPASGTGTGLAAALGLPARATVTLVTGDRVRVDVAPDGTPTVTPLLPSGAAAKDGARFLGFGWGADRYLVPDDAVPYLGTLLDPRLFDVTYLVRAKLDDAHRATLPVTVRAASAKAAEKLPAVHVTGGSGAAVSATLSKDDAGAFGRLLADHWRAARNARSAPYADALTGVSGLGLAVGAGAPPLPALPAGLSAAPKKGSPHFHTLTLKFVGMDGKPAMGVGWVQNVDDARLSTFLIPPYQTEAVQFNGNPSGRLSVPDGTYSLAFGVLTPHPGTQLGVDSAIVARPEVRVDGDTTLTFDARDAKPYRPSLDRTVDVQARQDQITLSRTSVTGGSCGGQATAAVLGAYTISGSGVQPSNLSVTPTGDVDKGRFDFDAISVLNTSPVSTAAPTDAPRYFLDFPHRGRIPDPAGFHARTGDLVTVHEHVYTDPGAESPPELAPIVSHPWRDHVEPGAYNNVVPGDRTDYWYTGDPKLTYAGERYFLSTASSYDAAWHTLRPGSELTNVWGKAPQVPSGAALPTAITYAAQPLRADLDQTVVAAGRQDDNAMLFIAAAGDSDPAHYGRPVNTDLRYYRDGTLTASGASQPGGAGLGTDGFELPMLPGKAHYRLVVSTSDESDDVPADQARRSETDWSFTSGRHDPAARLSKSQLCAPDPSRGCSFLPLLFVRYDLALSHLNQAEPGAPFDIAFTVAHQQNQPAPQEVSATVSVSYDDGRTWSKPQDAAPRADGTLAVTVKHPPLADTDGFVSLRVRAHDAAGSAVEQTVIRAYGLAGSQTDKAAGR